MLNFISAQDNILPFVNQMVFLAPRASHVPCGRVRARLRALPVVSAALTPRSVRFVSIPIPNICRAVYHTPSRSVNARPFANGR